MNYKSFLGYLLLAVGVLFVGVSMYAKHSVTKTKEAIREVTTASRQNFLEKQLGAEMQKVAESYEAKIRIFMLGGVALAILGTVAIVVYKRKS